MRVGLTYDLKNDYLAAGHNAEACAEFDSPDTIDAIDAFLKSRGYQTVRIGNVEALVQKLAGGERWDLVFNIAEGLYGRAREAQVPALLDAYQIPYVFSDPLVLSLTLDKALTKRVLRDAGIATAEFRVAGFMEVRESGNGNGHPSPIPRPPDSLSFPLFVKPNAEGTGKGITAKSLVHDEKELRAAVNTIHARFEQPALIERYLPGREFTVGVTGTGIDADVISVMEILFGSKADACGYTYDNKQHYEERVRYRLADDAEALAAGTLALDAWRLLGCRDGGRIDLRSDAQGIPHFLEVNPLAGLHPELGDLVILAGLAGIDYSMLLGRILDSALGDPTRFPYRKRRRRAMLELEIPFRKSMAATYRAAPLDAASFYRHYRHCALSDCLGMCCNGGVGFYMTEETETIASLVKTRPKFFASHGLTFPDPVFYEEKNANTGEMELFTETRPVPYPEGLMPAHFPDTACVFKRLDGACSLQLLGAAEGKNSWHYKPFACWLFPIELEWGGKPYIRVAHASTDENVDDTYPGFVGFTRCGAECSAGGKPAYQVLEKEIATLSSLLDRDLLSEILAQGDGA